MSSSKITVIETKLLAQGWGRLTSTRIDYRRDDGTVTPMTREVYDHGDAASILLVDPGRDTVLLVRQFRYPVLANGDENCFILEACAGLLEGDDPLACVRREAEEETGHAPQNIRHIRDCYLSPGSLKERVSLFIGEYDATTRRHAGGGLAEEGEEIELVELAIPDALAALSDGRIIDGTTTILLQHLALERLQRR
ncbi:nudix-type nucleoside diphosphatase, YffH/AdpP family [Devosia crocina]|uniref:GDP-mannose pyrophosphatase n=1 Tax=Devosia crocina TaxID=429728 RepID=A0A1I7NS61_9HYPH|nr:NUDIX domain-containing protein [Devosia crocina]SFV37445.1 nudix-type nucleoside diphosphatase, YffH/AdpP family [Devosia crocina]